MAPRLKAPIQILWLEEGRRDPTTGRALPWDYFLEPLQIDSRVKRIEGAFRALSVEDLCKSPPVIRLSEWADLRSTSVQGVNEPANYPPYAAISHVWEPSEETARIAKDAGRPLSIIVAEDPPKTHEISWHGLVEAAKAAKKLDCAYLWLDLLCLDQLKRNKRPTDKALQIANMANIYKYAKAVICMPGGVSAVQSASTVTAWMDRAWTLQEAVMNEATWMYLAWPHKAPPPNSLYSEVTILYPEPDRAVIKVKQVEGQKYLVTILHLFSLARGSLHMGEMGQIKSNIPIACLEGKRKLRNSADFLVARHAVKESLFNLLSQRPQNHGSWSLPDVWAAILMRTSSRPADVVYSITGFFDVQLGYYEEDCDAQAVFNEFARKAATLGGHGMGWLAVGDEVPRDLSSSLIPSLPRYDKSPTAGLYSGLRFKCVGGNNLYPDNPYAEEGLPWYQRADSTWALSSDLLSAVDKRDWSYHMKFDTDSQPHILCVIVLTISEVIRSPRGRGVEDMGGRGAEVYASGSSDVLGPNSMVILVASRGDSTDVFALTLEWTKEGWVLKPGHAAVKLESGTAINKLPRKHFTVGKGSQVVVRSWPCDHDGSETSTEPLPLSYGVILLENQGIANTSKLTKVVWFGKKASCAIQTLHAVSHTCFISPLFEPTSSGR